MVSFNLSDTAVLDIKGADYCCIISDISQSEAINIMQISTWPKKPQHYNSYILLSYLYIKIGKEILTFGDIKIEKK